MAAGALLLGRVTYEGFAAAWPSMNDDAGFADRMNGMPKYVVSTSLARADWNNTTVVRGKVADEVEALKKKIEGDILIYGSGRLVQTLMRHDLVDEYRLMVYPIVLGGGNRLFGESDRSLRLRLIGSRQAGESLILTYRPDRAAVQSSSDEARRAA
jgi:dihydrofolate reductase